MKQFKKIMIYALLFLLLGPAITLAANEPRRLGEALVELGYLKEEDLSQGLRRQMESLVGLPEVLAGEPIEASVTGTDHELLSILTVGSAPGQLGGRLSPTSVSALIGAARQQFNTILIDTGPVPASLEASLVCPRADGVIFVVSQGAQRNVVERGVEHLKALRAKVAGFVFNRAAAKDVLRYHSMSRQSRRQTESVEPTPSDTGSRRTRSRKFGPVANATARCLPRPDDDRPDGTGGNGRGGADDPATKGAPQASAAVASVIPERTSRPAEDTPGAREPQASPDDSEAFLRKTFRDMFERP